MPALDLVLSQVQLLEAAQRLMFVNVLLILAVVGSSAGISLVLVRRSMRQRVEAERLAAMGTATARILHQVKNPLQTIMLHAEMLEEGAVASDPSRRRSVCETIIGEAGRMSELLDELSAYASGVRRRLETRPIALGEVVAAAVRGEVGEAERLGIGVVTGPLDEASIDADVYFLRQAIENVLRNAREALSELDGPAPRRLQVAVRRRRTEAVVEIRDNGAGIAAERLGQIFEPFLTTKGQGMGLGLPIAREIVEGHGGRIEVRSWPGGGTLVTMSFPLLSASLAAPSAGPDRVATHGGAVSGA